MLGIKRIQILSKPFLPQRFVVDKGFLQGIRFSRLIITAPLLHTFQRLHAVVTRPTIARSLRNFRQGDALLENGSTAKGSTNPNIAAPPPQIAPPSLKAHGSLRTEIPYYRVIRFTATLPPYTVTHSGAQTVEPYRGLTLRSTFYSGVPGDFSPTRKRPERRLDWHLIPSHDQNSRP